MLTSSSASCIDGNIRLVDGETEWEGRLEVCFNQRWRTVGGEAWDTTETDVVCRELEYQSSIPGMNYSTQSKMRMYKYN